MKSRYTSGQGDERLGRKKYIHNIQKRKGAFKPILFWTLYISVDNFKME